MSITVLLVEDHMITRQGLRSLLDSEPTMEVIAEAGDGRTAIELARQHKPEVVIMDITMSDMNGFTATKQILKNCPETKVLALSMHSDSMFVTEMLKNGASGYLLKDCAFEELATAIRHVAAGRTYLSPSISSVVLEDYLHHLPEKEAADLDGLSERERDVLQLMAEGKSTKQIALKLHISIKTVETHRRQIMNKLNMYSVAELTKFAIRKGLTGLE